MKSEIFAIFDAKTQAYMEPWFTQNSQTAQRAFAHSVNDPTHPLGMDPADYTLFHLGFYENDTGTITMNEPKLNLGNGLELIRPTNYEGLDEPNTRIVPNEELNGASAGGTK